MACPKVMGSELRPRSRQGDPKVHGLNDVDILGCSCSGRSPSVLLLPSPLRDFISDISDKAGREGGGRAGTARSPGPVSLRVLLALAGRWVCWPAPASSPAGQSTQWLAPRPLGWAGSPPPTGMQLAARSRWAGWPGPLAHRYAASWLCYAWCLGTSGLASVGSRADMLASYGWAAGTGGRGEGSEAPPLPGRPLKCLRASANGNPSQSPPPRHSEELAGEGASSHMLPPMICDDLH